MSIYQLYTSFAKSMAAESAVAPSKIRSDSEEIELDDLDIGSKTQNIEPAEKVVETAETTTFVSVLSWFSLSNFSIES